MWACVWWGGVEKWPFPSLGGRGSPLPKWAESPHRGNVNEQPHPPLHPASYLMMQQIIPLTYSRAALCDHEFYCASSTCPALRPPSDFLSSRFCERSKLETWSESSSGLGRAEPRVVFLFLLLQLLYFSPPAISKLTPHSSTSVDFCVTETSCCMASKVLFSLCKNLRPSACLIISFVLDADRKMLLFQHHDRDPEGAAEHVGLHYFSSAEVLSYIQVAERLNISVDPLQNFFYYLK